jgi:outer membrane immunogenic protein
MSFWGLKMKKLIVALAALAAFTGSASAADLAARPYTKAPMMEPLYNWTGFYIFGGVGGGLWDADTTIRDTFTGACVLCGVNQRQGGDGWFGTVGAGYDWQFGGSWVAGIFGDGQFGSLKGTIQDQTILSAGQIKLRDTWAAGVRVGYLVAPNVLSYVNAGYTGSDWSGTTLRRRKLPEYLRYRCSRLVHEDRISCRLFRYQEYQRAGRWYQCALWQ